MFNELPEGLKKNILDLHHNKNLQYFNTSVIIIFTYFIGVIIALLTGQIDITDSRHLFLLGLFSIVLLGFLVILLLHFKNNMRKAIKEIGRLKL